MIKRESIIQKLARVYLVELSKVLPIEHWRIPVEGEGRVGTLHCK